MTNRRHFLKTAAAVAGSLILPRILLAKNTDRFFFIHADSCNDWPVLDPVSWSLRNAHDPILERAAEGLGKVTASDGDRIIRLVVRRCHLNLIELHADQVTVHHWGQNRADLRPFFKSHGLACPEVEVVLRDCKKEVATTQHGDDFLFGDRLATHFPFDLFQSKWGRRFEQEPDDWQAAPETSSGFAWDGVEDGRIPWAALKSAWRRSASGVCQNCDVPTLLVNFGLRQTGMLNRSPCFDYVCWECRRSFRNDSVKHVGAWIVNNLDAEVRPGFQMLWGRRDNHAFQG